MELLQVKNALAKTWRGVLLHGFLIFYLGIVIYPIVIMVFTSLKTPLEVFQNPLGLPRSPNLEGYHIVWSMGNFVGYFQNSVFVTTISLVVILTVSTLAAYALGRFRFRGDRFVYLFFLAGMMIPIRLGVINLFEIFRALRLIDNLWALIATYAAMGIPFSVLIISSFVRTIPKDLEEAARIDGASELGILLRIVVPLLKPALATAAIYHFVPIWNDFYFPLTFIHTDSLKTLPLGTAIFFGQFDTNWPVAFAALTTAALPALICYFFLSKLFIKGLTAGAIKG